ETEEEQAVPSLPGHLPGQGRQRLEAATVPFEAIIEDGDPDFLAVIATAEHDARLRDTAVSHRTLALGGGHLPSTRGQHPELFAELLDAGLGALRQAAVGKLLDAPSEPSPEIIAIAGARVLAIQLTPLQAQLPDRHPTERLDLGDDTGLHCRLHARSPS